MNYFLSSGILCNAISSVVDANFLDVSDMCISRISGRKTGMHCTIIVPVISDEYQMLDRALR